MLRFGEVRLDTSSIKEYPDGSIRVTGRVTQPGLRTYHGKNGPRTEYQPADELARRETLDTLAGSTITIMHPPKGFVTADTWKSLSVGHIGDNVRQDASGVDADLYIRDASAVASVKRGDIKHLSWGYKVDYDPTPGTTADGKRYDGVQRNLRGNHVAMLPVGVMPRGGEECAIRLDSEDNEECARTDAELKSVVDLETLKAKIAVLESELTKVRNDSASLPQVAADLTAALAKVAELSEQLKPERLDALADERAAVVTAAKADGIETAGKSTVALKRAVVSKRTPVLANRVDSMSDAALDAVFVVYGSQPHPSLAAVLPVPAAVVPPADGVRTDAAPAKPLKVADMYAKSVENSRNAWKNSGDVQVRS